MKIYCQYATHSTREVAKKLGLNINYVNNIESYFVTNNIITQDQLADDKIEERAKRIQDFLDNKKEEAKQVRYAIPEYETEEFNPEIHTYLTYFDPNFTYIGLLTFKNASDFINWKNKQQNPDLFKTPQDAYLYELWRVMEEAFNSNSSEKAKEIAESKLINYRKEIAPYTKEDINNNEAVKKASTNNINEKDIQSQLWKHMQNMGLSVSGSKGMQEFLKTHNLQLVQQAIENPEVQKEMDEIKQKAIANGTFMKAPNGRKSNLTERQWLQVRTKAFKDWFGDWEKEYTPPRKYDLSTWERTGEYVKKFGKDFLGNDYYTSEEVLSHPVERKETTKEDPFGFNSTGVSRAIKVGTLVNRLNPLNGICQFTAQRIQAFLKDRYGIDAHTNIIEAKSPVTGKIITHHVAALTIDGKSYIYDMPQTEFISTNGNTFNVGNKEYKEAVITKEYAPRLIEISKDSLLKNYGDTNDTQISVIKNTAKLSGNIKSSDIETNYIPAYSSDVSKVVDENGEPLVVYHGTGTPNITTFDLNKTVSGKAFWFANEDAQKAVSYGSKGIEGFTMMPLFVNMRKPLLNDPESMAPQGDNENYDGGLVLGKAEDLGFDEEDYEALSDMGLTKDSYLATGNVSNPNQLKSATDNVGTFSRTNNDITAYTTPQGEVYGFVDKEGNVYLDETKISPEHPIHEYTHLWDRVVQQKNPKLWNRGIELMKQTTLWNEILNSEHYGKAWQQLGINGERLNNLIASEVHARLTGTEGEVLLKKLAKKKGQSNIISKLKEWLLDIWKTLGETFGTWNKESLDNLTLEDFNHLTIRDFAKGYNPVSNTFMYNDESNVQSNNIQVEEFKIEYTPIGKSRQTYTIKGSHIYNKEGKEVFAKNSKDRNKIFANLAVLQGRAVVIQHKNSSYVVNNRDQIISVTSGKIMEWGKENGDRKAILEAAKEKFEKNKSQAKSITQQQNNTFSLNFKPEEAEFYSGAAEGSDKAWEEAATKAGIKVKNYTITNWDNLSNEWKEKIDKEYQEVVNTLGRKVLDINSYAGKLVRRDMMQADKADAIFAVGEIASNGYVNGDTGYATTRGIIRDIPVYLFDQKDNTWKVWNKEQSKFIPTSQPTLTKNAAVIGTRKLQDNGRNAISELIDFSLGRSAGKKFSEQSQETVLQKTQKVINQIQEDTSKIKLTEDEHNYINTETNDLFARTTTVIQANKDGKPFEENDWKLPSTTIGTQVDRFVRDFFDGKLGDLNTLGDRYYNATTEQWQAFMQDLQKLKDFFDGKAKESNGKKLHIVPKDITLTGTVEVTDEKGNKKLLPVAGTVDLLAYDDEGNFYIYDMKTKRNANIYDSDEIKWKNQLSLYKQLLEQKYGVKVIGTGIIPIKVDYLAPKTENGTAEYTAKEGQLYNHGKAYTNAQPRQVKELGRIHRRTTEPLDIRFEKLKDAEKKLLKDKPIAPVTEEFNPNASKSVLTINLDDDMSEAMEADADVYAKARAFFEEREKQNAIEEQKAEDRYNKALAYLDEQVKTMPYTGKTINANEELTLTKLGKLITPTQLNDRINYIARSFSSQIDLAVEEMTETIKEQLAEAKAEKDETKINKLNHALKVLENPDKQREKAVKMLGSNTLINRMKQEIQDAIDSSEDPNIKNQYQILSDYFIDIFNLATPIMEQYENVKFTIHKTNILDGSNLKEGASIEMTESTEDLQNEENAYEDSDDGDRAATGNEGWSFKIKFEDPHNTLTRDVKKVLYNLVKMNGDEVDVDDLGQPRYIAFNQAYAILLDKLANKIVEPQDFVQKDKDGNISYPLLEEMTNKFPWVNQVLDALDVDNTDGYGNLGTMFYSAFKRYFTHYYMLRGNKFFPMNEMTPVESALAETTGNYEHGNILDENSIYNSDKTINQEHINNIKEKIKHLDSLAAHFNDNYIEIAEGLNSILRSIGFNTTAQELIGLSQDGEYMKNYRILKSSINRILSIAEKLENKHLIQESKDEIKKIAPILGTVSELNNCTSFRQNGNNYPSYTPCSFLSNMIDHLKSDKYFKQYIEEQFKPYDKWFYDEKEGRYLNGWLNLIMTNPDVRNHLSLREMKFIAEGSSDMFNNDSQAAVEYNEWLPNQIRKSFLHLYFDTPNDSSSKIQYADYAFPIFSDSEMAAFIRMPKYIKNFRDRLTPKLRDVVLQEINRITKVNQREKAGVSKIQHFDKRGKDFLFIPEMNAYKKELFQFIDNNDMSGLDAFIDEKLKEIMKQKVEKALSADQESIIEFVMNSAKVKTKEEAIEKFAEFVWNNAYAQSQIIQLTVTDLAYYKNEIDFQKRYKEVYASGTRFNSESKYGKKNFNIIYLADAVVTSNSYGLVEETLNKAVEEKRLTLAEKYNILSMFSKIKSTDGQGFRTLTSYRSMLDMMGQWTPRLQALYERLNNGTWKYEDFENILQTLKPFAYTQTIQNDGLGGKIRIGHQIKDSEFVLLAIYNTLAMGGTKDISQNTGSPQLRALNMFMEENGIDAAIFESGVKTGGQGIIDINHSDTRAAKVLETKLPNKDKENKREYTLADAIMHEYTTYYKSKKEGAIAFSKASPSEKLEWGLLQMLRNGNITQEAFNKFTKKAIPTEVEVKEMLEKACKTVNKNGDILEDLNNNGIMLNTSVVHSIPTSDYMIAQQNPEHLFDAQSVAGSQNRNLIEADFPADFELKFKDSFDKNHVLKGNEINKLCSDLIIENLLEDFETIKADFKNIETIQKILIKAIQASNKYGNDMINALQIVEVNGKKQFNIPTNNINTLNKLQELVLSVFSNRITKQKNKKGAACTLVSSFGFTHDLHVIKDKEGNLQFEVYMPWHSQKHLAPFLVDVLDDDGKVIGKKIDIEKVKENDPKLLEGFGYRIPTEGKYSMMSFIIKGFLPQENGSTIMMPADTIVYAGEDFDKLCVEVKLR